MAIRQIRYSSAKPFRVTVKPKFKLARHVSTRHVRRVEPMHFAFVEFVEQHGSTHSTRRARLLATYSLLCVYNLYKLN